MINHINLPLQNFSEQISIYTKILESCGYLHIVDEDDQKGFGRGDRAVIWFSQADGQPAMGVHVALEVSTKEEVQAFHAKALELGWKDNGSPGFRPEYSEEYYGAFAIDSQGNNIEAVTFIK